MPAPLDWSAAGGIEAVLILAADLGPREAARRLHLSLAHGDALRQIISRRQRRQRSGQPPPVTTSHVTTPIVQIAPVTTMRAVTVTAEQARLAPVTNPVTAGAKTALEAHADAMADHKVATLSAMARAAQKGVEHLADQPGDDIASRSAELYSLAKTADITHGLTAGQSGSGLTLNLLIQ